MPYIANPLEGLPIRNSFITDQSLLGATPATDDTLIIYDISATALKQLTIANMQASILVAPAFTGVPTAPTANAGTNTTQLATTAFVTAATTALNTVTEMTDVTISSIGSGEILKWNGSAWINQELAEANILTVAGPTFTGVLTVGNAVLSEADLEQIDDLTAGTAIAGKALVISSNKDIGTIRNLTIDGTFSDGNYTFDTSGNVTGLGTIGSGNITSTGTVQGTTITATTAFVPDASDGAALGTAALEFSDLFLADAAVVSFGDDDDVTLTHVHNTGLLMSSTDKLQFGDAGTFIHQSSDGVLTIESDTTVDINGAVVFGGAVSGVTTLAIGGTLTGVTNLTLSGTLSDGNYTFDTNGNVTGLGTIAAGTTTIGSLVVAAASITDTSGAITFGDENLTSTGVITGLTVEATGDTAAGDNAAMGYTSAEGLILTGQGSTNDVTIKNDADAAVISIPTGTTNVTFAGNVTMQDLTVSGTTTTVNSTVMTVVDPIIHLQTASGGGALSGDTNKDVGLAMQYHNGSAAKTAFLGFDDSAGKLTFIPDATIESEVITSGSIGTIVANLEGTVTASGTVDMNTQDIDNIRSATFIAEVNAGNGSADIDWGAGQKQYVTLSGNVTLDFVNPDGPCNLILKIIHSGGGRTVTWGDGSPDVKWPAGTAPTLSSAAGTDIIAFYFDGSIYYGAASVAFA